MEFSVHTGGEQKITDVGDLHRAPARHHALSFRRGEPGPNQLDQQIDAKAGATRIASVAPLGESASNSSARRRVGEETRLRALRRGLPTEDIVGAYGMAMRKSSRAGFVPLAARPGLGHPQPFPLDAGDERRDAGKLGRGVNRGRDLRNGVAKQPGAILCRHSKVLDCPAETVPQAVEI
jgi:hypothetical protein